MKNLTFLALSIFVLSSCSNDDDEIIESKFLGEWELIRTTGQFEGSERTGAEMEWQESHFLRENGTFSKTRISDNETYVAEGTFIIHDEVYTHGQSGVAHISMVHNSENNLIATCYSDKQQEELIFITDKLMESTWNQCDGLGLEYAKKATK